MRIFLSKLVNYSPILTKTFSFWENWGKFSVSFLKFSHDFCQCIDPLHVYKFGERVKVMWHEKTCFCLMKHVLGKMPGQKVS